MFTSTGGDPVTEGSVTANVTRGLQFRDRLLFPREQCDVRGGGVDTFPKPRQETTVALEGRFLKDLCVKK